MMRPTCAMHKLGRLLRPEYALPRGRRCYSEKWGYAASLAEHLQESELLAKNKPLERLPVKPPFVKNLFAGKFDTDFLAFPEPLPEARVALLERNAEVVRQLMDERVDTAQLDRQGRVPPELLERLAALKLYGLSAPRSVGGAEFTHTERARIMEIVAAADPSLAVLLFQNETLGHRVLSAYGDDRQKGKLLRPLVTGAKYAALCLGEAECGSDATKFETHAVRSGGEWLLSGAKVWVTNADRADLFVVAAKVRMAHEDRRNPYYGDDSEEPLTPEDVGLFLVERNAAGLQVGARYQTDGLRAVPACEVRFDNVVVPEAMVLTEFYRGYDVVKRLFTEERYAVGCVALAQLKAALDEATAYCVRRRVRDLCLYEYESAQRRLGRLATNAYAVESVLYYTAGIMDLYEGQDCEVENAIAKVFSTEAALEAVEEAAHLMAGEAVLESSAMLRRMRDLRALCLVDNHNDLYRGVIALQSLQHTSTGLSSTVMENRNPLFYTLKNYRNRLTSRWIKADDMTPHLYLRLKDSLHPSLMYLADQLEYCVLRFEHGVVRSLSMMGPESAHDQMCVRRMADCAILLYAMTAVLSRASRAYCVGSENADYELVLAETFVRNSHDSFTELVKGLIEGEYYVTDHNYKKLAQKSVEAGKYYVPTPYLLNY